MERFLNALRAARKLELCIIALILAIVLLFCINSGVVGGQDASSEEMRMQRILSAIDGAGRVRVMLSCDAEGSYTGAVIAASGADNMLVKLRIQSAVQTLTGLELSQIDIVRFG